MASTLPTRVATVILPKPLEQSEEEAKVRMRLNRKFSQHKKKHQKNPRPDGHTHEPIRFSHGASMPGRGYMEIKQI